MIENHRDEEVRRRWDALADEDGGFIQISKHRSDFKHALSTLQRLQQRSRRRTTRAYLFLQAQPMEGTKFIFYIPGGLLIIQKVKKEVVSQVLSERGDPFLAVFGKNLRR